MIHSARKLLLFPSLCAFFCACAPTSPFREAENLDAKPFNQLVLAGNACGPAALLNSYRFGKPAWRKLSEDPAGLSDRERIRAITRGPAMRESSSLPGRARWSRNGVNLPDLCDIANEIGRPHLLPQLSNETLFLKSGESQRSFLKRVHSRFATSLKEGFPPILSIRRLVKRNGEWHAIQGHFVTITSVPSSLGSGVNSFAVRYVDPWGGSFNEGEIRISARAFLGSDPMKNPNLEAIFPQPEIGHRFVKSHEETYMAVSAFLGR
ncbi:hypothetical protein ACFSSA_06110 [Luteolibacter algae]|uniref:Peptidase C39-like domain-containing protein n=1 Tax=Luteolibacter algae TaxID=454151 RepID=A0ABW5D790_9BACT